MNTAWWAFAIFWALIIGIKIGRRLGPSPSGQNIGQKIIFWNDKGRKTKTIGFRDSTVPSDEEADPEHPYCP